MVFPQRAVARQQIPHGVILLLERLERRHACQAAELILGQNFDLPLADFLALDVDLFCALQLVAERRSRALNVRGFF